jgi:hypothetical protein
MERRAGRELSELDLVPFTKKKKERVNDFSRFSFSAHSAKKEKTSGLS